MAGTCTWCGHPPHPADCARTIRAQHPTERNKTTDIPCPCARKDQHR